MENIIIVNETEFENKVKEFIKDGNDKLHVVSDFDKTLTRGQYKDNKAGSIISHLRKIPGRYLTPDYASRAQDLFNKYHPIEIDPKITIENKMKSMEEWWRKHYELLIECGINKSTIKIATNDIISDKELLFRDNHLEFFKLLKSKRIPLIIMSASLGDLIEEFIIESNLSSNNIHVIANSFEFDSKGNATHIKRIIHVFNKHEMAIKNLPIFKDLKKRKNIILLGDSLGDLGMIDKFHYNNLIKIGFLNENFEENLEEYKKNFDVLILNDGPMDFINELLNKITREKI